MTTQADVHRFHRHEAVSADPEFNFETFAPVLMMSSIGLTLSLLILALVGS
jgi:hypothetical protein